MRDCLAGQGGITPASSGPAAPLAMPRVAAVSGVKKAKLTASVCLFGEVAACKGLARLIRRTVSHLW